jgi:hypothetical protein
VFRPIRAGVLIPCLALAGAGVAVVSGCGASGPAGSGPGTLEQQALSAMSGFARCVRAHGVPDFPDPQVGSDGVPRFPDSAPRVPTQAQQACRAVAARIPPEYTGTVPASAVDLQKLLAFAHCMRAHGIPDWPDPNSLGEFPIDQRIRARGKELVLAAGQACARLNPDPSGGIDIVEAP